MKRPCCYWCHKTLTQGDAYRNPKTGSLVCGSCRVDPVLTKSGKGCKGVHKSDG